MITTTQTMQEEKIMGNVTERFTGVDIRLKETEIEQKLKHKHTLALDEMMTKMRDENEELIKKMRAANRLGEERGEKIKWFESKLNKWVKLFGEAETDSTTRHNELIGKINELDLFSRRESRHLNERINNIKGGTGESAVEKKSDNVSDNSSISRQTGKRLVKAKTIFAKTSKKNKNKALLMQAKPTAAIADEEEELDQESEKKNQWFPPPVPVVPPHLRPVKDVTPYKQTSFIIDGNESPTVKPANVEKL